MKRNFVFSFVYIFTIYISFRPFYYTHVSLLSKNLEI